VKARDAGRVDLEALKGINPKGWEDLDEAATKERITNDTKAIGNLRDNAMRKAINLEPYETNHKLQRMVAVVKHDLEHGTWTDRKGKVNKGKPAVIFATSAEECAHIHQTLEAQGVKTAYYHGGLNSKQKSKLVSDYQAGHYGAMVLTPAGEAGIGLQKGKASHNWDVPYTEKAWNQRNGRAFRQGQQGNVDQHDWHTDTDYDRTALRRLKEKSVLAEVWQNPVERLDETGISGEYQKIIAHRHQDHDVTAESA
jgi:superfamily II DNA/RNA helicase